MRKNTLNEGFYEDSYEKGLEKDRERGYNWGVAGISGTYKKPKFDSKSKNWTGSKYQNAKGLKIAMNRLEDLWENLEKVFFHGSTEDERDVKTLKVMWPKYVREYNSFMKKAKETGCLTYDKEKDEMRFVSLSGDLREFNELFNMYNPYFGRYVSLAMQKGGDITWAQILRWSEENYDIKTILGENYKGKFVYKVNPLNYRGKLNESINKNLSLTVKSEQRLNRKQLFERVSAYLMKKYQIFVENVEVEAGAELEPGFLRALHHIVDFTFPVFDVTKRKVQDGEGLNDEEIKKFIDIILSEDISEMLGSSEPLSKRVQSKFKDLESKNAKIFRIYRDGIALDTFVKEVCGVKDSSSVDFYKGSYSESINQLARLDIPGCQVKSLSCEKDYCLVLVIEK